MNVLEDYRVSSNPFHSLKLQMAAVISVPNPTLLYRTRLIISSSPLIPQPRNSYNPLFHRHDNLSKRTCTDANFRSQFLHQALIQTAFSSRRRGLSQLAFDAKSSSGSGEEDNGAVETVLKLYNAIKNQSIRELSDIIGDECRCVCNFFSFFQPFQGKQQVLDFFKSLMKFLGNNFEFVVNPTLHDGLNVGVSWRLQWNKTAIPLGKGFSFYILQVYHGRVVIRNMEMFMEPLLHIEPLRLKITGSLMAIVDQMSLFKLTRDEVKKHMLALFLAAIILLFLKPGLY